MNVYQRLNAAREEFHTLKLKKSGHNKFAGYYYFELADFLIPALSVFKKHGLCAVVSFAGDIATMRIVSVEDGSELVITSPMGSAALKGCHEVQNIGAVETYQRRYLWVAALEIVEHDALDATTGQQEEQQRSALATFNPQAQKLIRSVAQTAIQAFNEGNEWTAYEEVTSLLDKMGKDGHEVREDAKQALYDIFKPHSALRAALKRMAQEERQKEAA